MKIATEFEKINCLRKELSKISNLDVNRDSVAHILINFKKNNQHIH